jgi:hypothetical protein
MYRQASSGYRIFLGVLMLSALGVAQTTIDISFIESAPTDRFVIENTGACTLNEVIMTIDLVESAGGLNF